MVESHDHDQGGSKGKTRPRLPPKPPENGTKSTHPSIKQENKVTFIHTSLVFISCYAEGKRNPITFQKLGYLFDLFEIRSLPKPSLWIRH